LLPLTLVSNYDGTKELNVCQSVHHLLKTIDRRPFHFNYRKHPIQISRKNHGIGKAENSNNLGSSDQPFDDICFGAQSNTGLQAPITLANPRQKNQQVKCQKKDFAPPNTLELITIYIFI
jgi:hypothetical protein